MANKSSNFPSNQLNNLPPDICAEITSCLRELNAQGKPQSVQELKHRIDSYFAFCEERGFRPGIETLCVSLACRRQSLWNWCEGIGCSQEWSEVCQNAKQFIMAFLETLTLSGKINPASSIFYLKNWGNYRDTISFDDTIPKDYNPIATRTPEEIAAAYGKSTELSNITAFPELPEVPD